MRTIWMDLMQFTERAEVEVQVFGVQVEALGNLVNGLLELHQCDANVLDFFRRKGLFLQSPDGLAFHQFSDEFDQAEDELHDRPLNVFGIGIPAQCGRMRGTWGSSGAWGSWDRALARTPARLPRPPSFAGFNRTLA